MGSHGKKDFWRAFAQFGSFASVSGRAEEQKTRRRDNLGSLIQRGRYKSYVAFYEERNHTETAVSQSWLCVDREAALPKEFRTGIRPYVGPA